MKLTIKLTINRLGTGGWHSPGLGPGGGSGEGEVGLDETEPGTSSNRRRIQVTLSCLFFQCLGSESWSVGCATFWQNFNQNLI